MNTINAHGPKKTLSGFARLAACALLAALAACVPTGGSDDEEDDGDDDAVEARLSVQGASLVPGPPPLPSLDAAAPRLSSDEAPVQRTTAPAAVPLDVEIDALGGVAALLLRVQDANEYFRVDNPPVTPRGASSKASVPAKALFAGQLVIQIPAGFTGPRFCVDVAGVDRAGLVSNYRRFCFVVPANDPAGAARPFANAGANQVATRGSTVTLDGSGSASADGSPLAQFVWSQISGPAVTLTQSSGSPTAQFVAPAGSGSSTLGFQLSVIDSGNRGASNTTTVTVREPPPSGLIGLTGTWVLADAAGTPQITVTFYPDGRYVKGGREDDPDCNTAPDVRLDGNGVEWGRFDYDAVTGRFQVQEVFFDNDGDCGLFERDQATQDVLNFSISGDTLTVTDTVDLDSITLVRAPVSTGIVGSWRLGDPNELPVVFTFFADNSYVMAHVAPGDNFLNPEDAAGVEVGTWSVDASNLLTTTQVIDTNSDGGLSGGNFGLSDVPSGTTLRVGDDIPGLLELATPGSPGRFAYFLRVPGAEIITVADLTGAWYLVDAALPDRPAPETTDVVLFKSDGTYLLGGNDNDPNCDADYGDANPDQSLDGPLDADGNGAEAALWTLDTGSGRLNTRGPTLTDSNGSCGLFNRSASFPDNGLVATVIDANTVSIDIADSGGLQIKRIPATAGTLIGAWVEDGTGEMLVFFADGTTFFVTPLDNGGIERGTWSLDVTDNLSLQSNPATNPRCIDTVGPENTCISDPTGTEVLPLSFNADRSVFSIAGALSFRKIGGP